MSLFPPIGRPNAPNALPIVKYEGGYWYVDFRLGEARNVKTMETIRFDSGGLIEEYFRRLIEKQSKRRK